MLLAAFAAAGVLAEFGQDAEGALGMQEGDLRVVSAGDGRVVQHGKACFLGLGDISGDVIGLESDVVDAFPFFSIALAIALSGEVGSSSSMWTPATSNMATRTF